jgi:hypothetical protein
MDLDAYLSNAIADCRHRLSIIGRQLQIDTGYVASPDADPSDVEYHKCQIELNGAEKKFLEERLAILEKWQRMGGSE